MTKLTKSIRMTKNELKTHLGEATTLVETTRIFRMALYWSSEILFEYQRKIEKGIKIRGCNSETVWLLGVINKIPKQSFALADQLKKRDFLAVMHDLECTKEEDNEDTNDDMYTMEEPEDWFFEIIENLNDFADLLDKTVQNLQQEGITKDISQNEKPGTIRQDMGNFVAWCNEEAMGIRVFVNLIECHCEGNYVDKTICREAVINKFKQIKSLRFN